MANLLPLPKAMEQLETAITNYQKALAVYSKTRTQHNWHAVAEAYSKVSSAHWEVEQYKDWLHASSGGK